MPNWCLNTLEVTGSKPDLDAFKQQAVGYSPWLDDAQRKELPPNPLNFHSLYPIPDEILNAGYHEAGYDWEHTHWGCKWGACDTELAEETEEGLFYRFDTAWSPPEAFFEAVSQRYPRLTFHLEYEESGEDLKGERTFQAC